MQHYCSEPKTEALMNIGLTALKEIEEEEAQALHADNPHKLMRALDVLDILTCDQIITNACLARKASSQYLNFARLDYPENDPKEWHKFITINNEDGQVKVREKPIDFYEPLKETYEAHCGLL
jgi:succinate dehydrogenase/fumarate reductase flavoprotein subunit